MWNESVSKMSNLDNSNNKKKLLCWLKMHFHIFDGTTKGTYWTERCGQDKIDDQTIYTFVFTIVAFILFVILLYNSKNVISKLSYMNNSIICQNTGGSSIQILTQWFFAMRNIYIVLLCVNKFFYSLKLESNNCPICQYTK